MPPASWRSLDVTRFLGVAEVLTEDGSTPKRKRMPDWGGRDLKIGTLRSAIRQLDLDWKEFQEP